MSGLVNFSSHSSVCETTYLGSWWAVVAGETWKNRFIVADSMYIYIKSSKDALHSKTIIIRNGIANIQPQETSQGPGVAFEYKGLIYRLVFDKAELRDTWLRLLSRGRHETEYNQGNKDQSPALENVQSNIQNTQTENQHPVERLPSYHSAVAEIPQPNQQRLPAWQTQSLSSSSYSTENRPPPYSSTQHDSAKPLP